MYVILRLLQNLYLAFKFVEKLLANNFYKRMNSGDDN